MAKSTKIKVMLSSRGNDRFPLAATSSRLADVRLKLKKEIEEISILAQRPYEVWVDEEASEDTELDAWAECIRQAKECDIFIAIYNGNAGWTGSGENAGIGICHAEFMTAYLSAPGKTTLIDIFEPNAPKGPNSVADLQFQKRIRREYRFGVRPKNLEQLEDAIRRAVVASTVRLLQKGVAVSGRGRASLGPALDWSRLDYNSRSSKMSAALRSALQPPKPGRQGAKDQSLCAVQFDGKKILFRIAAVPDAMSVAAAREMVGQPHLTDASLASALTGADGGPVHLIACHRGVTGSQAQRMLGFPDASVIVADFGVYAVDPVQAIQIVLLANCIDDDTTQHGVQRFMEWLSQSAQADLLTKYAIKRKGVVALLAQPV